MNKKIVKVIISIFLFSIITFTNVCFANENKIEVLGATYEVTENAISQDIGYNIKHTKDIAQSSKKNNELYPQSVNVLEVPSTEQVRVVSWTFSNPSGWTKNTVRRMAEDFENKNPGWVVVAAVNGDFFDINGTNKALPYQTGGVCVSNGEVYRPFTNGQTIGFKNDASKDSLVAEKKFEVSNHILSIYDDKGDVIYETEVKHFNEEPVEGEVSIWFTYRDNEGSDVRITLPSENTYYVNAPERLLAMTPTNVYGKGTITHINEERTMFFGRFGIQTSNKEIQDLLKVGTEIRVQQHIVGDYEECTDITGGGVCLVRNGEAVDNTSNMDTHPRTCVGMKEDGTLVFVTIDGRQDNRNMHGMAYNEMSATMLYYGCHEAYNLDGGGSTTMIIRNAYGDFDVMNSPSDNSERHDSNSLLIVVPEMSLGIKKVTDTQVEIDCVVPKRDVTIENIKLTINDVTKEVSEFPYIWEGLVPSTSYELQAEYELTYKNSTQTKQIFPIQFKTGVNKPYLAKGYYFENGNNIYINYDIENPANIMCLSSISSGSYFNNLNSNSNLLIYDKSQLNINDVIITLGYNLNSSVSQFEEDEIRLPKVIFDVNGGYFNETSFVINSLPTPYLGNHAFVGWEYNGEVIQKLDYTNTVDGMVLKALFTPLGGKKDESKKGCKKSSSMLFVETISVMSIALLLFKKRN